MKIRYLLFLFFYLPSLLQAQNIYKSGSFILKGQVKNAKTNLIDFSLTSFFDGNTNTIKLSEDGSFNQSFTIQNKQRIFFAVGNDLVSFLVVNKDTVEMSWDESDFSKTFSISGKSDIRTKELYVEAITTVERVKTFINLNEQLFNKAQALTPENKFILVNDTYNGDVKKVLDLSDGVITQNLNYFITGLYFKYTEILRELQLLPLYKLRVTLDPSIYPNTSSLMDGVDKYRNYSQLNYDWFVNVSEFRYFIYNYVRFYDINRKPFASWSAPSNLTPKLEKPKVTQSSNFTLNYYKTAQISFAYTDVKDWFIAKLIFDGFKHEGFTDVEKVYNLFTTTCQNPYLKDTLQKYYTGTKRLKPGNPAPGFTLKNENGQTVSLSDFKGKVVYLDFWGVYCGPCITEIKNYVPAMHKRFEGKGVVFVNICVDVEEKEWKVALKKYNIKGVNLLATGWERNPVVKAYNVSGIPHYILIDKTGAIAENNAAPPSRMENQNVMNNVSIGSLLK